MTQFNPFKYLGIPEDTTNIVQKVLDYKNLRVANRPKGTELFISEKLDGVYCFALYCADDNEVHILSRTFKEYTSMEHLKGGLNALMTQTGSDIIIFEAYNPLLSQPAISGYCRDTKNQHKELHAYVHDCLSLDEFRGDLPTPYVERIDTLEHQSCSPFIHIIPQYLCCSLEDAVRDADTIIARGGEGVVVRVADAPYARGKRNSNIIKIKKNLTYDLRVIGLEEGKGKYVGKVGKLVCRYKNDTLVKVGTGLADCDRAMWWVDPEQILGRIVEIEAMSESTKGVLREPRFKGIRYDKIKGDF